MLLCRISIVREIRKREDFCVIMLLQTNIENGMTVLKGYCLGEACGDAVRRTGEQTKRHENGSQTTVGLQEQIRGKRQ